MFDVLLRGNKLPTTKVNGLQHLFGGLVQAHYQRRGGQFGSLVIPSPQSSPPAEHGGAGPSGPGDLQHDLHSPAKAIHSCRP